MAVRRPLVRSGGADKQLPAGDTLLGLPLYAPAYLQGGTLLKIQLTSTYGMRVFTQGGVQLVVGAVLNG